MPWAEVNGVTEYVTRSAPSAGSVRAKARIVRPMEVVGGSGMSRASRAASAPKLRAWKQNVRQSVCTVCRTRGEGSRRARVGARLRTRVAGWARGRTKKHWRPRGVVITVYLVTSMIGASFRRGSYPGGMKIRSAHAA